MRILGVTIPDQKRIDIALTYLYGVGRSNVKGILEEANIDFAKKSSVMSEEEINRIQKALEKYKIEGDLRSEVQGNIKRLKDVGSYRGMRHSHNLPVRGQRTRSNARTKRGKRVTIGAIKKEVAVRMGLIADDKAKPAEPKK
ncbi:30S ribosomal protein S13 [Candidatus Microgenomates bacterium]|nr:30S ribosomal protein S13 [Candidatus Microgenomates bacterium]